METAQFNIYPLDVYSISRSNIVETAPGRRTRGVNIDYSLLVDDSDEESITSRIYYFQN